MARALLPLEHRVGMPRRMSKGSWHMFVTASTGALGAELSWARSGPSSLFSDPPEMPRHLGSLLGESGFARSLPLRGLEQLHPYQQKAMQKSKGENVYMAAWLNQGPEDHPVMTLAEVLGVALANSQMV